MEIPRNINGGFRKVIERVSGTVKDKSTSITAIRAVTDLAQEKFIDAHIDILEIEAGFGEKANRDEALSRMDQLSRYRERLDREVKHNSANPTYKNAGMPMASAIFDSLRSQTVLMPIPGPEYEVSLMDKARYISAMIDINTARVIFDIVRDNLEEERDSN